MGTSCSHEKTCEECIICSYNYKMGWKCQVYEVNCVHCPAKNIRKERTIGIFTGTILSDQYIEARLCDHKYYHVDEKSQSKQREQTLLGSELRLFMGHPIDGIQYDKYLVAHAECIRCSYRFYVISEFKTVWEHQVQRHREWYPLYRKIKVQNNAIKKVLVPIIASDTYKTR